MSPELSTPKRRTRIPAAAPRPAPARRPAGWYAPVKVGVDFVLALVLLVPAAPFILVGALLVKLTSRGPAFYSQMRVGRHGRVFRIYKLRTMTDESEKHGAVWCKPGDPRVTAVGRFLRATHLDELPQLWNVLRGDMSLVGPRPERPEFVPRLEQALPHYRDRLAVRPGITGLAQVQLPADTDIESVRRKLVYDRYYIEKMGFWMDLRLVLSTALKMLHVPFIVSERVLRVPGSRVVEKKEPPAIPPAPRAETVLPKKPTRLQPGVA